MKNRRFFDRFGIQALRAFVLSGLVGFTLALTPTASTAEETSGIAGGPQFPNGAEFPFIAGMETTLTTGFFIQNLGSQPLDLGVSHSAPRGIIIEPSEGQKTTFAAGEAATFRIDVTVTEPVVPGTYPMNINIRQSDPDIPDEGGSIYIPAVSGEMVIDVVGASAFAKLSTVSSLTGAPAVGDLSLFYIGSTGIEVQINETRGSGIESMLVPGDYKFTFDLPGLQRQDFEFSIEEDQELDLVFEIPTLEFLETAAVPTRDDRDYIQSVALTMDVFNNLQPIEEQVFFKANIFKDGEVVESFVIGALPNLPEAGSLLRANYTREGGFSQGDWEFQFELSGDTFSVVSDQSIVINSPGIFQSYLQEIVMAAGALLIIGLLIPRKWWSRIFKNSSKSPPAKTATAEPEKTIEEKETISLGYLPETEPDLASTSPKTDTKSSVAQPSSDKEASRSLKDFERVQERDEKEFEQSGLGGKEKEPKEAKTSSARWPVFAGRSSTSDKRNQKKQRKAKPTVASAGIPTAGLETVLAVRKRLLELENEGIRTLALNYKIDSIFVNEGEKVIERSTGKPYQSKQIKAIEEFRGLEAQLDKIETPAMRAEAIKVLVREQLTTSA